MKHSHIQLMKELSELKMLLNQSKFDRDTQDEINRSVIEGHGVLESSTQEVDAHRASSVSLETALGGFTVAKLNKLLAKHKARYNASKVRQLWTLSGAVFSVDKMVLVCVWYIHPGSRQICGGRILPLFHWT